MLIAYVCKNTEWIINKYTHIGIYIYIYIYIFMHKFVLIHEKLLSLSAWLQKQLLSKLGGLYLQEKCKNYACESWKCWKWVNDRETGIKSDWKTDSEKDSDAYPNQIRLKWIDLKSAGCALWIGNWQINYIHWFWLHSATLKDDQFRSRRQSIDGGKQ